MPGVPIYLFGGILLTAAGGGLSERAGDDDADDGTQTNLGIVPAIIYTNVVSLCIKLCACTIQQKVRRLLRFGGGCGGGCGGGGGSWGSCALRFLELLVAAAAAAVAASPAACMLSALPFVAPLVRS